MNDLFFQKDNSFSSMKKTLYALNILCKRCYIQAQSLLCLFHNILLTVFPTSPCLLWKEKSEGAIKMRKQNMLNADKDLFRNGQEDHHLVTKAYKNKEN